MSSPANSAFRRREIEAEGLERERVIQDLARRGDIAQLEELALRLVRLDTLQRVEASAQRAVAGRRKGISDERLRQLIRNTDGVPAAEIARRLAGRNMEVGGSADWLARRICRLRGT